jgi:predicted N-acetyltransferase YhbS
MNDTIPVLVELATEKEAEMVYKVTIEAFKKYTEQAGLPTVNALEDTIETVIHDIKTKLVFVAYKNNEIVGSVRVQIFDDGTAYLSRFAVVSGHQKCGVGKELMKSVDEAMIKNGVHTLKLHTSSLVAGNVLFYYSRDFYIDEITKEHGYPRALFIKKYN